jgi:uncharacterized protein (DUF2336 family)
MVLTAQSLLSDFDASLPQASDSWRSAALHRIIELFVSGANSYSGEQIALFDAVIERLITKMDRARLVELSNALAGAGSAPAKVLANLARHGDAAISGPVLERARALPDTDLVEIADRDRIDPAVLARIAARGELSETVTDVLLKRGNIAVHRTVLDNPKARVSEMGFARLVSAINGDKALAAAIAARPEMPAELRPFVDAALS